MAYSVDTASRVTGLASGIDTDSMVKELMAAERLPLDKMEQKVSLKTWQRDAYRDMNMLFSELDKSILDMKLSTTYNTKSVSSSNEELVTATATAGSSNIAHKISNVTMATAAQNLSTGNVSASQTDKIDPSKSLWLSQSGFGPNGISWDTAEHQNKDIKVSTAGTAFKLDKGALALDGGSFPFPVNINVESSISTDPSSYEVVTGTSANADEKIATLSANQVFVNVDNGEMKFGSTLAEGSTIKGPKYDHNVINFAIKTYDEDGNLIEDNLETETDSDGINFTFDGTTSLNQVLSKINSSKAGVSAFYDEYTDAISIQRSETGDLNNGTAGTANMEFNGLFLTDTLKLNGTETTGKNALFTIDGLATQRKSNTFKISDVTYTLNDNFTDKTVSVGVTNDVDASYDKIMAFIDKYNETIETVNKSLQEDRYRDYKPLTDAQRNELSENEIELWEEKSKSGLLKGDSILSSGLSSMRYGWYSNVENDSSFDSITDIGITTSSKYLEGGKLEVDADKLKAALREDPESVQKLFSNDVEGSGRGIINRLEDSIASTIKNVEARAGKPSSTEQQYTLGRQLDDMADRISAFEDRLRSIEDRYWTQFGAMEAMIQQMNSQSSYLSQQFSY